MLPTYRRFGQQDYPNAPDWLGQFFNPLNVFCETTTQTLNKNLKIGENVQGQKFSTTFTTGSGSPYTFPIQTFKYTGGGLPNCCLLGRIQRADLQMITSPVSISSWFLDLNTNPYTVTVDYIAGLDPDTKYTITLLVI